MRTLNSEAIDLSDYERFCQEFDCSSVDALHPLASLEFCIKALSSLELSISLQGLEYELQQRKCRSVGPAMHCCNLVETTCEDSCDWETAFSLHHSFETLRQHSHLFIKDADVTKEGVGELQFVTRRMVQQTSECSVKGCRNIFPETHLAGWEFKVRCGNKHPEIYRVCKLRNNRYRRIPKRVKSSAV